MAVIRAASSLVLGLKERAVDLHPHCSGKIAVQQDLGLGSLQIVHGPARPGILPVISGTENGANSTQMGPAEMPC